MRSPGKELLRLWRRLSPLPGGAWLFARLLGRTVPYSGSVHPRILTLEPGHVRVALHDRRGVRNHLQSVHAIALANIGELASGLAMITTLPDDVRAIVVNFSIAYYKKARGTLVAESRFTPVAVTNDTDCEVTADIFDSANQLVARATVMWRLGLPRS